MNRRGPGGVCGSAIIIALTALFALPGHAGVYKWVDEKGVTHYSDLVPPEYVNRGAVQLNNRGIAIRKTDPTPTPEQRKVIEEEEAKKRDAAKLAVEQKRRDEALLNSYTNEKEIDFVRQRNISVVEESIATTQRRLVELRSRRQEIDAERVALEQGGKKLAAAKQSELKSIDDQIPALELSVTQKTRDIDALKTKYDGDLKRYRELTETQAQSAKQ
jgi:hypothetical protein